MLKFLNTCAEIEEVVGAIYRKLALSLPETHELRAIWLGLAEDEGEHARQIRLAARLPTKEVFNGVKITQDQVEELLRRAKGLQKELHDNRQTLRQVLQLSLLLEEDFGQVHVALAVEFRDESMRKMFQSLARDDERHAQQLRRYLAKVPKAGAAPEVGA